MTTLLQGRKCSKLITIPESDLILATIGLLEDPCCMCPDEEPPVGVSPYIARTLDSDDGLYVNVTWGIGYVNDDDLTLAWYSDVPTMITNIRYFWTGGGEDWVLDVEADDIDQEFFFIRRWPVDFTIADYWDWHPLDDEPWEPGYTWRKVDIYGAGGEVTALGGESLWLHGFTKNWQDAVGDLYKEYMIRQIDPLDGTEVRRIVVSTYPPSDPLFDDVYAPAGSVLQDQVINFKAQIFDDDPLPNLSKTLAQVRDYDDWTVIREEVVGTYRNDPSYPSTGLGTIRYNNGGGDGTYFLVSTTTIVDRIRYWNDSEVSVLDFTVMKQRTSTQPFQHRTPPWFEYRLSGGKTYGGVELPA